jgi:hypothetical protein
MTREVSMKNILMIGLTVLFAAGTVSAQNRNLPDTGAAGRPDLTPPAEETITGNLGISQGMMSLESGGELYYVMGLHRFIGFIDGLREGAAVSLTGYAFAPPRLSGAKVFRVTELRLNGKSYDLAPPARDWGLERPGPGRARDFRGCGDFRSYDGPPAGRNRGRYWGRYWDGDRDFSNRRSRGGTGPRPGPR